MKANADRKVTVCSICNGAFALGEAGLLDGRECTTHWRRVESLQRRFPNAKVLNDVMYVKSDNIYSSAGISAGIDLALGILEHIRDPGLFTRWPAGSSSITAVNRATVSRVSTWISETISIRKSMRYRIT